MQPYFPTHDFHWFYAIRMELFYKIHLFQQRIADCCFVKYLQFENSNIISTWSYCSTIAVVHSKIPRCLQTHF